MPINLEIYWGNFIFQRGNWKRATMEYSQYSNYKWIRLQSDRFFILRKTKHALFLEGLYKLSDLIVTFDITGDLLGLTFDLIFLRKTQCGNTLEKDVYKNIVVQKYLLVYSIKLEQVAHYCFILVIFIL